MAGPISGVGVQPQIPLTQSLQQNAGNDQLRESNDRAQKNDVASSENTRASESVIETQAAEAENAADPSLKALREEAFNTEDNSQPQRPGTLVDILV